MTNRRRRRHGWAACGLFAIALATLIPAAGAATPAVCANPDVLRFIDEKYIAPQLNATLQRDTVAEFPTADLAQVLCAMYVRREIFDYAKYGQWPRIELEPQSFLVKKLPVGFEVTRPR